MSHLSEAGFNDASFLPAPTGAATDRVGAPALGTAQPVDVRARVQAEALARKVAQLQLALDSRVVIEQAKGILAERYTVTTADAFAVLRRAARSNRIRIHELAQQVVASRTTPPPVAAEVRRRR